MTREFYVTVGDNFHCGDDEEGSDFAGAFETFDDALAAAKTIIDKSLVHLLSEGKPSMTAEDLADSWMSFGDSPAVAGPGSGPNVWNDSWEYAKARAAEMI